MPPTPHHEGFTFHHPRQLRLSIIIVNWNTRDLLQACLDSLRPYLDHPDCEIIVVDNASADDSVAMVARDFPSVVLIRSLQNLGFSGGNNLGIQEARGEYILLLNSDTETRDPHALWLMCDHLDHHPRTGALGARLLNPDGTVQLSRRSFPSYKTALFHRKSILTRLFPNNRFSRQYLLNDIDTGQPVEVDWVIGACLMTRRAVIEQAGSLDPGFFMYAEDVDWCYRIRQAGWIIEYFPQAVVMHHYEKSTSKAPFKMNLARHKSMWRFYRKHYSHNNPLRDAVTFCGIWARFLILTLRNLLPGK